MQRLTTALLLLFVFTVPWEYSLDLGQPFGNAARILGILLLAASSLQVFSSGTIHLPGVVQWLTLALFLYFTCSYLWTIEPEITLNKIRAYFQVMMIVWLVRESVRTPEDLRGVIRAFVAGCWALAILTLMDYGSASAVAEGQIRYAADGQDPNDVARFLDLGFPLAALAFTTERQWAARLLAVGYFPAGLMAVLLTASRGGFSAALLSLLGSAALLISWRPRGASLVFVGLAATSAALWLFVPVASIERLATIPGEVAGGSWNDRLNIWNAGWYAFAQAPLFGYGAGTFTSAAGLSTGDTAHNTIMAVLVTGGLTGLAIFATIVSAVVYCVTQTQGLMRIALGSVLCVWTITSMVGSVEENRTTWLLFGVIALAAALQQECPDGMAELFSGESGELIGKPAMAER